MKAAQKERFIKQKRNQQQRRRDGTYGRNWTPITTLQAAVSAGKRDHSSMVTPVAILKDGRNTQLLAPTTTIYTIQVKDGRIQQIVKSLFTRTMIQTGQAI